MSSVSDEKKKNVIPQLNKEKPVFPNLSTLKPLYLSSPSPNPNPSLSPSPVESPLLECKTSCDKPLCKQLPIYRPKFGIPTIHENIPNCDELKDKTSLSPDSYVPADPVYSKKILSLECLCTRPPVRYVPCDYCKEEHPSYWSYCPQKPCEICFEPGHNPCPYMEHIPRSANYDRVRYEVICGCGDAYFNEEKWFCGFCKERPRTRLKLKSCLICGQDGQHCTEECPNDEVCAAEYKAIRDYHFTHDMYPVDSDTAVREMREVRFEIARVKRAAREEALKMLALKMLYKVNNS